jgi:hypothetical protein
METAAVGPSSLSARWWSAVASDLLSSQQTDWPAATVFNRVGEKCGLANLATRPAPRDSMPAFTEGTRILFQGDSITDLATAVETPIPTTFLAAANSSSLRPNMVMNRPNGAWSS